MKLDKAELIFISLEIFFLTISVSSAPEIETGERYGCDVLRLNCSDQPGHVATGFIYGGHTTTTTTGTPLKKPKGAACPAPDSKSDCQAPTIDGRLRGLIQRCLWRRALCSLPINGQQSLGQPCFAKAAEYLVAKQFRCIKQSSVVDVCSESAKASPLTMTTTTNSDIYLLSKNYPAIVASSLDCAVTVRTNGGVLLKFSSLFMDLHPRTRRRASSSEETAAAATCVSDYVQFTQSMEEATGSAPRSFFFCGNDVVDLASNATTEVRFVSGPDDKHYGGFVIRVTAEDGHRDNEIPKWSTAAAAAASSGDTFSDFRKVRDLVTTTVLLSSINVAGRPIS